MGADGSGKSTVIDMLLPELACSVKGAQSIYQPSRKTRSGEEIWNHAYPPRGMVVSIFKLLFYAFQWWWLYHFRYAPLAAAGFIVLFDRFYFDDILIDPLKFRYGGPMWLARKTRAVLPGPDVYIVLDAPESVLALRKQEASLEEIGRLRQAFLDLECQHVHKYVVDASAPLSDVVEKVRRIIQGDIKGDD